MTDRRPTALLNKALIRSLRRINKDGGIRQPSLEEGVTSADRQDKLLLPNLSPHANHTSGKELVAAPLTPSCRISWRPGAGGGERRAEK